ncbi:hypothetical protein [Xanthocytophaga agilis]|uniref:Uncharacterized protein n=1 Tax=Xanthocytophaga agilis TaxID=3048010 RepID=A0AAE3UDM6_9BACT|nr:hypothetical protein [Xanthocytophaga agilis]MDJ1500506.1 hypothetical protein [Xanthocytophaga agilis]
MARNNFKLISALRRGLWLIDMNYAAAFLPTAARLPVAWFDDDEKEEEKPVFYAISSSNGQTKRFDSLDMAEPGSIAVIPIQGPIMKETYCGSPGTQEMGVFARQADNHPNIVGHVLHLDTGGRAPPNGTLNYQKHVPDIKVSEFFTAIQQLFGLAYDFDVKNKVLNIILYKDCIQATDYIDWTEQTERAYSEETVEKTGFTLKQTVESEDELNKTLNTDWAEYKIGAGGEQIPTTASTLHMVRVPQGGRSWLVPATEQKGSSNFVGTGDNNKFSLRLLLYAGLKNDSMGNSYPLGSAVNENYTGSPFTDRSLHYAGQWGLYENNWKEWIAFLNQTRTIQRSVLMTMADLLNLSPTQKIMIDHSKYFYEKISLSISSKDGIGKAKIDLRKVTV